MRKAPTDISNPFFVWLSERAGRTAEKRGEHEDRKRARSKSPAAAGSGR